jgi:hypothetical protein
MRWSADVCSRFYASWVKAIKATAVLGTYHDVVQTGEHEMGKSLVLFSSVLNDLFGRVLSECPLFTVAGNRVADRTAKCLVRIMYEGFQLDAQSPASDIQVCGPTDLPDIPRFPSIDVEQRYRPAWNSLHPWVS